MKELLSNSHVKKNYFLCFLKHGFFHFASLKTYTERAVESVKKHLSKYNPNNTKNTLPSALFEPYKKEICDTLRGRLFDKFSESEKYTRFCQWKNFELNIQV
jgi:beta-adrenergic-receptor kinase